MCNILDIYAITSASLCTSKMFRKYFDIFLATNVIFKIVIWFALLFNRDIISKYIAEHGSTILNFTDVVSVPLYDAIIYTVVGDIIISCIIGYFIYKNYINFDNTDKSFIYNLFFIKYLHLYVTISNILIMLFMVYLLSIFDYYTIFPFYMLNTVNNILLLLFTIIIALVIIFVTTISLSVVFFIDHNANEIEEDIYEKYMKIGVVMSVIFVTGIQILKIFT